MDKKDCIIILILFLLSILFYFLNFEYTSNFYSNIITFLSIIIGFTITSISVLYNTNCIKRFSKISKRNGTTVLSNLGNYYKIHIYFSTILVLFYILEELLVTKYENLYFITCLNIPLLLIDFFITYILISFFIKLFLNPNYERED